MSKPARIAAIACACVSTACLIPDRDIVVNSKDPCGEEWAAQTVGAYGYNGIGQTESIQTKSGDWLSLSYCVSASEGLELLDPNSPSSQQLIADIVSHCQARAIELTVGDNDDTCVGTAQVVYLGECTPAGGCVDDPSEGGSASESGMPGL